MLDSLWFYMPLVEWMTGSDIRCFRFYLSVPINGLFINREKSPENRIRNQQTMEKELSISLDNNHAVSHW